MTTISNAGVSYFRSLNSNSRVFLVRNGVDLSIFKPNNISEKKSHKIVGLIGNLHIYHEYSGLIMAAQAMKDVSFVIIGKIPKVKNLSNPETKSNLEKLFSLPNVKHHGWVPLCDLPAFISTFDAGLITYKTKKLDPDNLLNTGDSLKKYQYLACDVPVITSDCQEIDAELKDGIFIYDDEIELQSVIRNVIFSEKKINYSNLVKKYDWNQIVGKILKYAD